LIRDRTDPSFVHPPALSLATNSVLFRIIRVYLVWLVDDDEPDKEALGPPLALLVPAMVNGTMVDGRADQFQDRSSTIIPLTMLDSIRPEIDRARGPFLNECPDRQRQENCSWLVRS
jgi:hypothetical protein